MSLYSKKYWNALQSGKIKKVMVTAPPAGRINIQSTPRYYYYSELAIREGILMEIIVDKYDVLHKSGNHYNGHSMGSDTLINILRTQDTISNNLNRALEINSKDSSTLVIRGILYSDLGNYHQAMADHDKAVTESISFKTAPVSSASQYFIDLFDFTEAYQEDIIALRARTLEYRGYILISFNNSEGLADLSKAGVLTKYLNNFDTSSGKPNSFIIRAVQNYEEKNYNQALINIDTALSIDPDLYFGLYFRGLIYFTLDHENCDKVFRNVCKLLNKNKSFLRISINSGNENIDQVLTNMKWTLVLELCRKETINQWLSEYFSNETRSLNVYEIAYFIDELKDYDDLFLGMDVDLKKTNIIWDETISFLTENSISTRQKIKEFMIQAIYKNDLLNASEITHLLKRLQNAEDNYLSFNGVDKFNTDYIWNLIIKMFSKETFSTDQQAFDFLGQFANGIVNFNNSENVFFLARIQFVLALFKKDDTRTITKCFPGKAF
ncbi:34733_t:CDS:2 [Racocetra persica]|uniref:34733_t:CDS:1 n=1 Tax=Racocetra persica TaxID=160502 RepID=A0ACA9LB79_9GLOM|nr:34733_t:CDS:2 [Racocetra persica]